MMSACLLLVVGTDGLIVLSRPGAWDCVLYLVFFDITLILRDDETEIPDHLSM
jgi:hypothetical protein